MPVRASRLPISIAVLLFAAVRRTTLVEKRFYKDWLIFAGACLRALCLRVFVSRRRQPLAAVVVATSDRLCSIFSISSSFTPLFTRQSLRPERRSSRAASYIMTLELFTRKLARTVHVRVLWRATARHRAADIARDLIKAWEARFHSTSHAQFVAAAY